MSAAWLQSSDTLVAARFLHFTSLLPAFGALAFPLYTKAPAQFPTRIAALVALASGFVWCMCVIASIAGGAPITGELVDDVLGGTSFGAVWVLHMSAVAAFLVAAFIGRQTSALMFAGVGVASLAGLGHANAGEGAQHWAHLVSHAAHVLAAGLWIGGVWPLWRACSSGDAGAVVTRFMRVGFAAVGVLMLTGVANAVLTFSTCAPAIDSPYVRTLCAKALLALLAVGLAVFNQIAGARRGEWKLVQAGIVLEGVVFVGILGLAALLGVTAPS